MMVATYGPQTMRDPAVVLFCVAWHAFKMGRLVGAEG